MILRAYQTEAIDAVRQSFAAGRRAPLLVAPTGAGKTVIFSYITQNARAKGRRVMILTHRAELLDQTSRALTGLGVDHGVVAAGRTADPAQAVQVAGVQTLVRRLDYVRPPDLIIIDEAHHAAAGSWRAIVRAYPDARLLGVTATPERLDGKSLGDVFDDLIRGPEVAGLIAQGFLSPPKHFAPPTALDMSGVRTVAGDYNKADLERAVDRPTITGDAVAHYQRLCPGAPAIAFCTSILHATHVAQDFKAAGYRWEVFDGTLSPTERREVVEGLGTGALHGISSCEIVSEGFDLPCVTAAILLRPTQSLGLYLQQVGRVLRPHAAKTHALILDHVGNTLRHGLVTQRREWSLEGAGPRRRRKKDDEEEVKNRQCPACYGVHEPAPVCPMCGHVYEVQQRKLEAVDGTLQELTEDNIRAMAKREQGSARSLAELVALGRARGYKNPAAWATHILSARNRRAWA